MSPTKVNYYQEVVDVTKEFLGPAAERFINRQVEFHIGKDPKHIDKEDVLKLKDSLRVALGVLVTDQKIIDDAVSKFNTIAEKA